MERIAAIFADNLNTERKWMIKILRLQLTFTLILLGCVFILSCEYTQDVVKTDPQK